MRRVVQYALLMMITWSVCAQNSSGANGKSRYKEYHVSVNGNVTGDGSKAQPFKSISAAADVAMPGDIITVHAGVYREQIAPPRGGNSENERITYQAAKDEKVEIKGSEIIKGWKKTDNDTWAVKIPNSFFGKFNPYSDLIRGDWYWPPKGSTFHTGAVYLNDDWLMEALTKEDVMKAVNEKGSLWWADVDSTTTTIWAQFKNVDPNKEMVEINVRQKVFYPEKLFTNFITVRGFTMEHAATNWAPPTAEQMGLIGTNWSRGWIIENNTVQYSKCVGIALGKYGDAFDNKDTESAEGYVGTINRALKFGWNKGTIGGHLVRNNTIAYCEQTGIVGSMGCAFSIVEGNIIHDIHIRKLFDGAEMAGIKFHGAVDVQIHNNHIYKTNMGIWLYWMAQGVQVQSNLMHDNGLDIFLEVNHGPMLVSNNILLSKISLFMNSSGAAFVHNIFGGKMNIVYGEARKTPYHKAHSTTIVDIVDNKSGDIRFVNNLFVNGGSSKGYDKAELEMQFKGNVYLKGTEVSVFDKENISKPDFDSKVKLLSEKNGVFLEINLDKLWLTEGKRALVSTDNLGKAIISNLHFENADGTKLIINEDYNGTKRSEKNLSPGPFEIKTSGVQKIKVFR